MTDSYSDTPAAKAPSASLWLALKDAIRGNADYTRIPLGRAIFLLAIPMMLELVMESTFAVVDIYFVGKLGRLPSPWASPKPICSCSIPSPWACPLL